MKETCGFRQENAQERRRELCFSKSEFKQEIFFLMCLYSSWVFSSCLLWTDFQQAGNNLELMDEWGWSEPLKAQLMLLGINSQAIIKQHENCFYLNPYIFYFEQICVTSCNVIYFQNIMQKTFLVSSECLLSMDVFKEKKMINPKQYRIKLL